MVAVYMDYNATAPVRLQAAEAAMRAMRGSGNASSSHGGGRAARRLLEDAREAVAALVGAFPAGVVFTSGGTEANALALTGFGPRRLLVSAVEHPSVLHHAAETIPVDGDGVVDLAALEELLRRDHRPTLVSVMRANNETGVLQPVAEVARLAHVHGALVHCDAVQAAGKVVVDLAELGVDCLSLSGHKLGGPQGAGALVLADGDAELIPLLRGGGQERGRRPGTENLPGIAGFGVAAEASRAELKTLPVRLAALRERLEQGVRARVPRVRVMGEAVPRLPNTSCLALHGLAAPMAVMALDLAGVAVSAGSACNSGKVSPSHVLTAMGESALAGSAIRASLGWASGEDEVDGFVAAFAEVACRLAGPSACAAE